MKTASRWTTLTALLAGLAIGALTAGAAQPRYTIAVIPKGTTHEFWKSVHAGALQAGKEANCEIIWKGPLKEDDREAQIKVVESFLSRGVDGIVLAPLDERALVPITHRAISRGMPVVIIDSALRSEQPVSFVATDNYKGGVLGARRLAKLLDGKGRVIMMRYAEGSASTLAREAGFLDTMKKEFPNIEIISSNQFGGATAASAQRKAETLLLRFSDIDGIFTPNESTTFGMLLALQRSGRINNVKFVGFDSSTRLNQALQQGLIQGLVLQNPVRMGYLGVKTMIEHLDGKKVEKRIDTGCVVATPENMKDPEIRNLLEPDLSILEQ